MQTLGWKPKEYALKDLLNGNEMRLKRSDTLVEKTFFYLNKKK